ncbi:MAG: hypothetical protein A3A80_00895 [Candidatus Terrybacteria bacterium RIFCSPLOWO2_01_FULL_44_24]|uniref:Response regulatory domain-containing protein n=1 Tax=Candidatus Terrybacteria bacterium RIFCSPHIGHO2_01_FULL_43_35 TaxID=1802361 RepID=A0A1G2PF73_9BACT|nr:MAG: hypothetical protein A2828_02800 [Candidatus Terrybacteria bacterium RIFCSPHIGHO2_01_FULL_43_35]OHA51877.1 MAG: hypothetical protein A3A80_00895 [Candidatus Terrybacteria bacterium RIFCSPLOWO2_01_FULL_44_24]
MVDAPVQNTNKPPVQVLVVEDDPFLSKAYKVKFEHEAIAADFATDGEMALVKVKDNKPKIVLLDIMLPKKNGFDFLADVKKDPELKDIPVLILSNLGQEDDIKRGMELGAVDYIVKTSMKIQDVVTKIRKYLV